MSLSSLEKYYMQKGKKVFYVESKLIKENTDRFERILLNSKNLKIDDVLIETFRDMLGGLDNGL